jgi:hypothetical protein
LYRQLAGNFHAFLDFFLHFGSRWKNACNLYAFLHLLPVKCQTKFLILAVKFLTNCLLSRSIFLKIVCSKLFLPNNLSLRRILIFYRLFEAYYIRVDWVFLKRYFSGMASFKTIHIGQKWLNIKYFVILDNVWLPHSSPKNGLFDQKTWKNQKTEKKTC